MHLPSVNYKPTDWEREALSPEQGRTRAKGLGRPGRHAAVPRRPPWRARREPAAPTRALTRRSRGFGPWSANPEPRVLGQTAFRRCESGHLSALEVLELHGAMKQVPTAFKDHLTDLGRRAVHRLAGKRNDRRPGSRSRFHRCIVTCMPCPESEAASSLISCACSCSRDQEEFRIARASKPLLHGHS